MRDPNQRVTVQKDGRVSVKTINTGSSMAQQQYKDECDINNIMNKYNTTGQFTHLTSKTGHFADFTQITDYREMLETVQYANDAFASLPADVRARFGNDPAQLLNFVQDEKNYDEGVKLGLVQPKTPSELQQLTAELKNANTQNAKNQTADKNKKQTTELPE